MWDDTAFWILDKSPLNCVILPPTNVPVGPVSAAWGKGVGGAYWDGGISWVFWAIATSSTATGTSSRAGGATTSSSDNEGNTASWTLEQE